MSIKSFIGVPDTSLKSIMGDSMNNIKSIQGSLLSYNNYLKSLFNSSIVAFYPLNETSGTNITDVYNGKNGVYSGVVLNQTGFISQNPSILVNGDTDYLDFITNLGSSFPKAEGTLMFWFKVDSSFWALSDNRSLFVAFIDGTNRLLIRNDATNELDFYWFGNAAGLYTYIQMFSFGWNCIAITWSVSGAALRVYVNGVEKATPMADITAMVGDFVAIGSTGFLSNMSHFLILNRPATPTEVYNAYYKNGYVVFEGDSRTASYNIPEYALSNIDQKHYVLKNNAGSGSAISDMAGRGAVLDTLLKTGIPNILVVWCGYNNDSETAQEKYDGLSAYCLDRKAAGWKVIICTEIDSDGWAGWSALYLDLNILIKADYSFADAIVDLGANANLQDATNVTYFNADTIHPTVAGAQLIGSLIAPQILALT